MLSFTATLSDGSPLPSWLSFNSSTRTFTGTPPLNFNGEITVSVTASDGAASVSSSFTLTIAPVNDAPVPGADAGLSVTSGVVLSIPVATLLVNDTDVDGDTLSIVAVGNGLNGTAVIVGSNVQFTPAAGYAGPASFEYTVSDGQGATVQVPVSITVGYSVINGTSAANVLTGTAADHMSGLGGNDTLNAGAGNDLIDGGTGFGSLVGGAGDDIYIVDSSTDTVVELTNEGLDSVRSTVAHTLSADVENPTLTGIGNIAATGNAIDNILIGNAGSNTLNGLAGNDTMAGGQGNDTYIVDGSGDTIVELFGLGADTVQAAISYTLTANVETLVLTGTGAINGTGHELNNWIRGNASSNVLDGGLGADTLIGGLGNDTFIVDDAGDVITEAATGGLDAIFTSVTFTASTNVEAITLTGMADLNATGNASANVVTGNSGNNTLSGAAGADTLVGGAGNDSYIVDNAADVVTELADEGTDTVLSTVTHSLGVHLENLTLTGVGNINAAGNTNDNVILGNSGNNTLNGGGGADTLRGGAGNDIYAIDSASDIVSENANEGTDTVQSSISWLLGINFEGLTLTGTSAINGTGNDVGNTLTGNAASNVLDGGLGADSMIGGLGDDTYSASRS
jgi:trimeric autotransporter adhesin